MFQKIDPHLWRMFQFARVTPWPGAGKVSGNHFEDRNWLLLPNYLDSENKNEIATGITSPWPPIKEETKDK